MIYDSRFTIRSQTARSAVANRQSSIINHQSQRGVALIITLIMLAVITFMATTFLVLSQRERGSVNTNTEQTTARFTADSALERAKVELLAGILATTNDQYFDLMVPTNFFNPFGFDTGAADYRTNVNYNYQKNGSPLTAPQQLQNMANLLYNPRPPVLVLNRLTGALEPQYYLDLNRNGRYDTNGYLPAFSSDPALPYVGTDGNNTANLANAVFGNFIGDPEWIGVLRYPERPHSADNPFVARWTYLVLPAGKTLDVNYLHNQVATKAVNINATTSAASDGYVRNQGVGTWELNLAAFLADLNTNVWNRDVAPYTYRQANPSPFPNTGTAFDDARALLSYRYSFLYGNLSLATSYFAAPFVQAFRTDNIDEYSDGPFMYGAAITGEAGNQDDVDKPWPGSYNPNHYFTTQDFFDPAKASANFANNLRGAGLNNNSYDRYTFYRMLAQLGTDSAPVKEDKINLNYRNVTNGIVTSGMETNLYEWNPLEFFTNSAARMFEKLNIRDNNGHLVTITNIPIWPTTNNNFYTPAVHRVLQLAANIYDASTNSLYPCIYRPLFSAFGTPVTNVIINGYELVNGPDNNLTKPIYINQLPVDVNDPAVRIAMAVAPLQSQRNIYGAPWIIGAKKGFPNLNQIAMQSVSQMTRKLLINRPTTRNSWTDYHAKQMFILGVSNSLAVEVWNSYNTPYPHPLFVQADCNLSILLTNDVGLTPIYFTTNLSGSITVSLINSGLRPPFTAANKQPNLQSFAVPMQTNILVLPDSVQTGTQMKPANDSTFQWDNQTWDKLTSPHWGLSITNNLRCYVMDTSIGRVVDYVLLSRLDTVRDLTQETLAGNANKLDVWTTTTNSTTYWASPALPMSQGVIQQIQISQGSVAIGQSDWNDSQLSSDSKGSAIANFLAFLTSTTFNTNYMQAPFTPTAKIRQMIKWQANDPLVHYLADDLVYLDGVTNALVTPPNSAVFPKVTDSLYLLNQRYSPWGGYGPGTGWEFSPDSTDKHMFDTAIKDPLVMSPDNWNFPTNKFPSVGWLGRVHRGTPWQTAYMKSANIVDTDFTAWRKWSASANFYMATNIAPIKDRQLFEVFTTSLSDSASRGQLSVNQTNLAAWSAVLSGVIVLTNDPVTAASTLSPAFGSDIIHPAGVYTNFPPLPPLVQIVQGINNARARFPSQTFTNLGDILATPEFTDVSPYLLTQDLTNSISAGGISDEVLERIPQQVMSLLTISHNPQFVVYAYGQTLRPANNSIVTANGVFNGLCTNYQVTAETATRAVIHVEGAPAKPHIKVDQYNVLPPD